MHTIVGKPLAMVTRLEGLAGDPPPAASDSAWSLRGMVSNERYATRDEKTQLVNAQAGLGRPEATCAVLIPIRKNSLWWGLTQDERRTIFADQSQHIQIGLRALPQVARRLHHCRDLSDHEPFDFLTWFEFSPAHTPDFDRMLADLRLTMEWQFVDREVEIRLRRTPSIP